MRFWSYFKIKTQVKNDVTCCYWTELLCILQSPPFVFITFVSPLCVCVAAVCLLLCAVRDWRALNMLRFPSVVHILSEGNIHTQPVISKCNIRTISQIFGTTLYQRPESWWRILPWRSCWPLNRSLMAHLYDLSAASSCLTSDAT